MPDNLQELIEDATLAFHGEDYDAFRAAAARLAMPLIAAYEKLGAELAEAKQHAEDESQRFGVAYRAWRDRAFKLGNGVIILPGESDEEFDRWLEAAEYGEPADDVAKLTAELATTKADLANERAVRAVQATKLAHAARLVPKPHKMFGFDDPDAPDEFKSWIDSSYAFWGIERPTEGGA